MTAAYAPDAIDIDPTNPKNKSAPHGASSEAPRAAL
jgi:hypothetical protein